MELNAAAIEKLISAGVFENEEAIEESPEEALEALEAMEADGKGTRKRVRKVTFVQLPNGDTVRLPKPLKASPKSRTLKLAIAAFLVRYNREKGTDFSATDVRFATLSDWTELTS